MAYICNSSSIDGKNQFVFPPPLYALADLAAPDEHTATMASVFAEPVPISVPNALGVPINVDVALHHAMLRSIPTPLHPAGAASKYLPVVFPTVDGVIKMIPPAGPTSPTTHADEQGADGVIAADTADIAPVPREFTAATLT